MYRIRRKLEVVTGRGDKQSSAVLTVRRPGARRSRIASLAVSAAFAAATVLVPGTALASGELDLSFGSANGFGIIDAGATEIPAGAALDNLGRVVLAGQQNLGGNTNRIVVGRFTSNGAPDPTFGVGGFVTSDVVAGLSVNGVATAPDGSAIVVGTRSGEVWLVKFDPTGSLDTTFGNNGASLALSGFGYVPAIGLQSSGKIVLIGSGVIARVQSNGTLDASFGTNGRATVGSLPITTGIVRADDSIVVVGTSSQFVVAAFTASGALDTTFGTGGTVSSSFAGSPAAASIAAAPDGGIAVGGTVSPNPFNINQAVFRVNANGTPDVAFGSNGQAIRDVAVGDFADGIAIQPDGKVVAGGTLATAFTGSADAYAVRYLANGSPDPAFGTNGVAIANLGQFEFPQAVFVQPSGRIVLPGHRATSVGRQGADMFIVGFTGSDDVTPPVVTGSPDRAPDSGIWYRSTVTIDWTAVDDSGTSTDPANTVAAIEGTSVVYTSAPACDPTGNCATGETTLSIDVTDPAVVCDAATFAVNEPGAAVTATVSDAVSGPAATTVTAAVATSTPGSFTATLTGTDQAGRETTVACPYRVSYVFSGFEAPVDNRPAVNRANAGRTIPIKWRLTDYAGAPISDPSSFVSLTTRSTTCDPSDPIDVIETYSGASGLQYLGDGYWKFNWATPKSYAGNCRVMSVNLADGSLGHSAAFQFR